MPRHPPNALKSLDALITNVHPCLVHQLIPKTAYALLGLMFRPASADGRTDIRSKKDLYVLDLPAAVRSSATSHVSQPCRANSPFQAHSLFMPGLRATQANPFIHNVNQQNARFCKRRNWSYKVSTAKCRNNNTVMEWWSQTGSNRRPEACKATALPTELWPHLLERIMKQEAQRHYSLFATPHSLPIWWAWEDSNFRPHAYQARALTN